MFETVLGIRDILDPDPHLWLIFRIRIRLLSSVTLSMQNFVDNFFCLNPFQAIFQEREPDPDPHLWLMDPDPGGPKTCGSIPAPVPDTAPQHMFESTVFWNCAIPDVL